MKKYWKTIITLIVIALLVNLLACIRGFDDWYSDGIYPLICTGLSYITGWIPFAAGEIIMYIAALAVVALLLLSLVFIFLRKKTSFKRFYITYCKSLLMTFVIAVLVYSLMWIIPLRSSLLGSGEENAYRDYTASELIEVRNYLVNSANEAALKVDRDEEGHIIIPEDVNERVRKALSGLKDRYPRLKGYTPLMKAALCSDFLDWMGIGGYTYPFTKEMTYNKYVDKLWYMGLYAHEAAHNHGYFKENEATFLSIIALTESDDILLNYEGYLIGVSYMDDAVTVALVGCSKDDPVWEKAATMPKLSNLVNEDQDWASDDAQKSYEKDSHPAEEISGYVEEVSEAGWAAEYVILKEDIYEGAVPLLMKYYCKGD